MTSLLRLPHGFLRRHLSWVERGLVAAGLTLLLYRLMVVLPAYPSPWEAVVATAAFLVMLWQPWVGFFLVVMAALYPLSTLSTYLTVLVLAIALLGQRVFMRNLGGLLLVLSAPWLAQFHLEWVVVLLGGLWWGKSGGAWIGAIAALWGQVLFGMTGSYSDWTANMGIVPSLAGLVGRYQAAGSLETLKLLVQPLAPDATVLLYHLLQILLWAVVGGLVGGLAERNWTQQKHPWRAIFLVFCGALALLLASLALPAWLEQYPTSDFGWIFPGLVESALYAALIVSALEALRDFIEHPLSAAWAPAVSVPAKQAARPQESARPAAGKVAAFTRRLRSLTRAKSPAALPPDEQVEAAQGAAAQGAAPQGAADKSSAAQSTAYPPLPVPENLPKRDPKNKRSDDIIKIELD